MELAACTVLTPASRIALLCLLELLREHQGLVPAATAATTATATAAAAAGEALGRSSGWLGGDAQVAMPTRIMHHM